MNANAETMMLLQFVRSLRRAFEKEEAALQSIVQAIRGERQKEYDYLEGVNMGAFAASGIAALEQQVMSSLLALEELLGSLLPEDTLRICRKPLIRIGPEDHFIDVLLGDMRTIQKRVAVIKELENNLLARDPEEISASLPEHVRENIAEIIETELQELGRS